MLMFGVWGIIVDPVKQRLGDRSWQLVAYILHKANSFPQGQTYVNLLGFPLLTAMTLQAFVGMFFFGIIGCALRMRMVVCIALGLGNLR